MWKTLQSLRYVCVCVCVCSYSFVRLSTPVGQSCFSIHLLFRIVRARACCVVFVSISFHNMQRKLISQDTILVFKKNVRHATQTNMLVPFLLESKHMSTHALIIIMRT